jgi:hypothetical protein
MILWLYIQYDNVCTIALYVNAFTVSNMYNSTIVDVLYIQYDNVCVIAWYVNGFTVSNV